MFSELQRRISAHEPLIDGIPTAYSLHLPRRIFSHRSREAGVFCAPRTSSTSSASVCLSSSFPPRDHVMVLCACAARYPSTSVSPSRTHLRSVYKTSRKHVTVAADHFVSRNARARRRHRTQMAAPTNGLWERHAYLGCSAGNYLCYDDI